MLSFIHKKIAELKSKSAKNYWRNKRNECVNTQLIHATIVEKVNANPKTILEFGASWGANLMVFMENHPQLTAYGLDINPIVKEPEAEFRQYRGIVGDENALDQFGEQQFDVVFTSSVLDHIPNRKTVESIIQKFSRISKKIVLLEPYIEGVDGDVSNKPRSKVKAGLPNEHKVFATHCYLWDYDSILNEQGLTWTKQPQPLHSASLGPFYHFYIIEGVSSS